MRCLVRDLRRDCQWLITEADEIPEFDLLALQKFIASSFDPRLGWVRRPNSKGFDKVADGSIPYSIGYLGERCNGVKANNFVPSIAAFGDSYVFGRQVADGETWCAELSRRLNLGVLNFGVGNYGADQALLRYEGMELPSGVDTVILGFVPETISRIHSCWKHYLEFGNTFAFKPRFVLSADGKIMNIPCPVSCEADFLGIADKLKEIQSIDGFYLKKFRRLQFRGSYMISLLREPRRHFALITATLLQRRDGNKSRVFASVVKRNVDEALALYKEPSAKLLLSSILESFVTQTRRRGQKPLILVMPQLDDLRADSTSRNAYREFFASVSKTLPLLDMTEELQDGDIEALYVEDRYGGHFSALGNVLVAKSLATKLVERNGI
jgi:hypothetical protein